MGGAPPPLYPPHQRSWRQGDKRGRLQMQQALCMHWTLLLGGSWPLLWPRHHRYERYGTCRYETYERLRHRRYESHSHHGYGRHRVWDRKWWSSSGCLALVVPCRATELGWGLKASCSTQSVGGRPRYLGAEDDEWLAGCTWSL
jgi:hypothetical protein